MDFLKILMPQAEEQNNTIIAARERDLEAREPLGAITSFSFSISKLRTLS